MIDLRLLSKDEFLSCFAEPMRDVTAEADAPIDIWPYVEAIDRSELGVARIDDVAHVYRDANGRFDQVLLGTGDANVFLVIVIDLAVRNIKGHHLLDLNKEYGLD